jgi:hypothetical protein
MSMDDMVRDMRNRFLVAAVLSVPILLWSPIGREVLGFEAAAPFGLRDDVFSLLLSLPVIFYSVCAPVSASLASIRARRHGADGLRQLLIEHPCLRHRAGSSSTRSGALRRAVANGNSGVRGGG